MKKDKRISVSFGIYAVSVAVLIFGFVWSFFGIEIYERIAVVFLASVLLFAGSLVRIFRIDAHKEQEIMRRTFCFLFLIFLLLFVALVFIDGYFGNSRTEQTQRRISAIPFETSRRLLYAAKKGWISPWKPIVNIAGNLLLCMPFALFLPLLFKSQKKFFVFLLTVSAVVLAVEILQYATVCGVCDVDDVIFNLSGAAAAFGVLRIPFVRRLIDKITKLTY